MNWKLVLKDTVATAGEVCAFGGQHFVRGSTRACKRGEIVPKHFDGDGIVGVDDLEQEILTLRIAKSKLEAEAEDLRAHLAKATERAAVLQEETAQLKAELAAKPEAEAQAPAPKRRLRDLFRARD